MFIDPNFARRSTSILARQHFQTAYVTNNFDRALEVLSKVYDVKDFYFIRKVPLPMGGEMDIALTWVGNVNLEIIQGSGNPESFYQRDLPNSEFTMKHHHFGYLVPDEADWNALVEDLKRADRKIIYSGSDPSGLDFIYLEAPGLGHYLEYIRPKQAWIDLFESLPRH